MPRTFTRFSGIRSVRIAAVLSCALAAVECEGYQPTEDHVARTTIAGAGPRAVLFQADWSTGTGSSDSALRDAGKPLPFDAVSQQNADQPGQPSVLTVVSASGLGFPAGMANVLRVTRNGYDSYGVLSIGNSTPHWSGLGVGEANYWRVYLRVDIPDSEGRISTSLGNNPIQFPSGTSAFASPVNFWSDNDGTIHFKSQFGTGTGTSWPLYDLGLGTFVNDAWQMSQKLPKFTVLRIEWMFRRDTPTGYSSALRIYDDTNTLMWSEDGIGASQGAVMTITGNGQTTQRSHDGQYTLDTTGSQSLSIGTTGGYHSYSQDVYWYFGGVMVCRDTWCGPYQPTTPDSMPAPVHRTVLFQADWSTVTGSSDAALRDTGKPLPFDWCGGNAPAEVVAATGLGFPSGMANVLRITRNNMDTWFNCRIGTDATGTPGNPHWPQLGVGDANYWRVYLRVDIPDSEGNILPSSGLSHHPIQMNAVSGIFEPTNFFSRNDGTIAIDMYTDTANPWPLNRAVLGTFVSPDDYGQRLPKFTVLRFEWMIRRDTSTGYSFAIRIYDDANTLMWSEDGVGASRGAVMTEAGAGNQTTLKSHDGQYTISSLANYQSLMIGENGGWHSYSQDVHFYWGGLMLCGDTWCGPYQPVQ